MARALPEPGRELELEEQLFDGVIHGSLEDYEELLRSLRDVDARGVGQRTLLHLAVKGGKVDWVEMLLRLGADPECRDRINCSVLALAKKMSRRYPSECNRQRILDMIQLAVESNAARRCTPTTSGSSSYEDAGSRGNSTSETHTQESIYSLEGLSQDTTSIYTPSGMDKAIQSLSQNTNFLGEALNGFNTNITSLIQRMPLIKAAIHNVEYDLKKVTNIVGQLEVKVNLPAEDYHSLEQRGNETRGRVQQWVEEVELFQTLTLENPGDIGLTNRELFLYDCIQSLLKRAEILNPDGDKFSRVRELFQKLYLTSTMISCLMGYLQYQPDVKFVFDFESTNIVRMKSNFRDPDGEERSGSDYATFADHEVLTIYQASMLDRKCREKHLMRSLAWSMAEMSTYLAFENEGRPYAKEDQFHKQRYKLIMEEAGKKKRELNEVRNFCWNYPLDRSTESCREMYLIASVPGFVAFCGEEKATSMLGKEFPQLFNYYKWKVMATLLNKSKASA